MAKNKSRYIESVKGGREPMKLAPTPTQKKEVPKPAPAKTGKSR
jgi:hypothetical protein